MDWEKNICIFCQLLVYCYYFELFFSCIVQHTDILHIGLSLVELQLVFYWNQQYLLGTGTSNIFNPYNGQLNLLFPAIFLCHKLAMLPKLISCCVKMDISIRSISVSEVSRHDGCSQFHHVFMVTTVKEPEGYFTSPLVIRMTIVFHLPEISLKLKLGNY